MYFKSFMHFIILYGLASECIKLNHFNMDVIQTFANLLFYLKLKPHAFVVWFFWKKKRKR